MWTVFAILFLLLSVSLFVLRHAFPIPLLARHCFWWGGGLAVLFVLCQLWFWLRPSPIPFSTKESAAVRDAVQQVLNDVSEADGFATPVSVAVVHLVSDPTDEATMTLRREIATREGWTLVNGSPAVAFIKSLAKTIYEATSVDEYLRPGARVGIDVVFYGVLNHVSTDGGISRASLTLTAYDTRKGKDLFKGDVNGEFPRVRTAVGRAVVAKSRSSRIWIFAAIVLLLPWVSAPLSLRVLSRRTNSTSALVLGALVVLDVVVGLFLFYGFASYIALAVLAVCIVYDLTCAEILSRRVTD